MNANPFEGKARPIICSGENVRAILDGRKIQARWVIKRFNRDMGVGLSYEYRFPTVMPDGPHARVELPEWASNDLVAHCPCGKPGDLLWVRETWMPCFQTSYPNTPGGGSWITYRADGAKIDNQKAEGLWTVKRKGKWRSSIYMPRWASRLTLEVTDVRVEQVQDISNEDAQAEGCVGGADVPGYSKEVPADPYEEFAHIWDSLNAKRGYPWESNPWVWVVEFKQCPDGATTEQSPAETTERTPSGPGPE